MADSQIDWAALGLVHSGPDGFVCLGLKPDGDKLHEACNIPVADLNQLSLFLSHEESQLLERDSYATVVSMFKEGHAGKRATRDRLLPQFQGRPAPLRSKRHVRWLNACWVDIDCYAVERDPAEVTAAIHRAVEAGVIPPPSVEVFSGRGVWILFLLRESEDSQKPPGAFAEKVRVHQAINRQLAQVFRKYGADAGAGDLARFTRLPGSLNTKSGKRVRYKFHADDDQLELGKGRDGFVVHPKRYTLEELRSALRLELNPPTRKRSGTKGGTLSREQSLNMNAARWRYVLDDLDTLEALRNGFEEGTRNNALVIKATALQRLNGLGESFDVIGLCSETARRFRSDMKRAEVLKAIQRGREYYGTVQNQTLAQWLRVTPAEASFLKKLIPPDYEELELSRAEKQEHRRALILRLVQDAGFFIPSQDRIAEAVAYQGLGKPNRSTITRDIRELEKHPDWPKGIRRQQRKPRADQERLDGF